MADPTAPEPGAVTDALLNTLTAITRTEATLHALRLEILDQIGADRLDAPWARATEAEIALATGSSESTVNRWFGEANNLVHNLPATFDLLKKGDLTVAHARIIDRELSIIDDPEERAELETRVLAEAHRTTNSFRRLVRQLVDRRHPKSAAERHQVAKEKQDVWATTAPDGMGYLTAYMPAPEVAAVKERLDDLAHLVTSTVPDTPIGDARVDVLTSLLLGKTPNGPRLGQVKTTAVITLPASTLTGGDAMGELEGFGPVDAATARELAADATVFRKMLTDPVTGIRLTLGRERYRPTADQRLWLRLRDRRCRFPGCTRPARRSDLDHTIDWQYGGTTDDTNLGHHCERHHYMKHDTSWRVATDADGTLRYTSPAGRHYESPIPIDPDPPWVYERLAAIRAAEILAEEPDDGEHAEEHPD